MAGGLPGVHSFHPGNDVTFFLPIRPGDRIGCVYRPYKLEEETGQFAGRMVWLDVVIWYFNQRGEIVAKAHGPCLRVERQEARQRGKYADVGKPHYTEGQLQQVWEAYDREEIRGPAPRYWEDVKEGDGMPPIVRGPLRVTEIAFRTAHGGGRAGGATRPTPTSTPIRGCPIAGTPLYSRTPPPSGSVSRRPTTRGVSESPGWRTWGPTGWGTTPSCAAWTCGSRAPVSTGTPPGAEGGSKGSTATAPSTWWT